MREWNVLTVDGDGHGLAPGVDFLERSLLVVLVELVEVFDEWLELDEVPVGPHEVLPRALGLHALDLGAVFLG